MKLSLASLVALGAKIVLGQTAKGLTVSTSSGTFRGVIDEEFPNTRQFRSIPFAEPPVGSRRWLPPQKLSGKPSSRVQYSTKFPPSCPQFFSGIDSFWNGDLTRGNLIYNGAQNDTSGLVGEATSEDCLHLAIWTPTAEPPDEGGFPVMFFMTGGGFLQGGVELPWQIPTSWVERSQSHIVVSVNYRVSIFGFPNARGLETGEQNLGILDQRAALEWTRDNIEAFGGNPERIMAWGRSAGGVSADVLSYAYHEDPIAESFFMESCVANSVPHFLDPAHTNFTFVAKNVGCDAPCGGECPNEEEEAAAELDCMRQVSMIQITNFIGRYLDRGEGPPLSFNVVPDDVIIFYDWEAQADAGKIARRPSLISATSNEFSSLVLPWPPSNITEGPSQDTVDASTVALLVCPILNTTVWRNRLGPDAPPVFRFQYAATFPNLNVYDWLGAYHNSETPLIFGTYGLLDHIADTTEREVEMSHTMQDYILAFAKDPYNGPQTLGWEPTVASDPNGGTLLRFGGSSGELVEFVDAVEVDGVCLGVREYNAFP
ncbi:Pyrethroid hydrolase Ces2e [Paramyrothecium foliicola]|nr:Pyrethroid hydrolase Ces2e [Paramyrothecium foliicola]